MDILVVSRHDSQVVWFANDGNNNFGEQQIITSLVQHPRSVYAIDLDNDNDIDVLSASKDDNTTRNR